LPAARAFTGMGNAGLFQRWIRFNGVGALGSGLQLALVAVLVRAGGVHYLWATAAGIEAAVLHNFCWHECWTWADRRAGRGSGVARRLLRFHAANAVISLAGSLMLTRVLTGSLGADPIAANIASILACGALNFGASEWLVFRRAAAAAVLVLTVQPMFAAAPGEDAGSVDLRAHTVQAWKAYEQRVDMRYEGATATAAPFFALDAFGAMDWRSTATRGTVAMSRIEASRPGDGEPAIEDGKIHHWAGAIFVPGVSMERLLKQLADLAGHEQQHYEDVLASRLLAHDNDRYRIYMKIRRSKVITVTYNTEHDVQYRHLGSSRASARSVATKIAQLDDAGTPQERELKAGSDSGYLWRLNAYWRYEAINGGVLIECESVSLSRAIPFVLRPFATGAVEGVARESLERTLVGLRRYLTAQQVGQKQ
jgi:putative flippase GtrA